MQTLDHPWPLPVRGTAILPVFLPFAGCRTRCIYCAQPLQTGRGIQNVEAALARADSMLRARAAQGREPCELAFYGGTFTALPAEALAVCLDRVRGWQQEGLVCTWRCSTRPDCVEDAVLSSLAGAGCSTVELGIQTFRDDVLAASLRGYTAKTSKLAMQAVRHAGFALGVQLLPGLPGPSVTEGHSAADFVDDVHTALAAGCSFLRFYPCLVVEGTGLARLWREGRYRAWDVPSTIAALARGLLCAHARNIPVIRLGVAVEEDFEEHVLAGPRDKDLGTRVRARAVLMLLEQAARCGRIERVELPRAVQGFLWGCRGENRARLAELGLGQQTLVWTEEPRIRLVCS